eukprot:TsM_000584800 transcript=TsM_000584800 gene=TsM_000584800
MLIQEEGDPTSVTQTTGQNLAGLVMHDSWQRWWRRYNALCGLQIAASESAGAAAAATQSILMPWVS